MNKPSILVDLENVRDGFCLLLTMDSKEANDAMQDFWEYVSDRTFLVSQGIS